MELDDIEGGGQEPPGSATGHSWSRRREYVAWFLAAVGLVSLAASLFAPWVPTPLTARVARTTLVLGADQRVVAHASDYPLAVSPDGARFAYVAEVGGQAQLYVRELDALEPTAIGGTGGARHPFFSPDGQWIGFFAGGALQRVAAKGGAPLRICNVSSLSMGGSWGPGNVIVFATSDAGLAKVEVAGGTPQPLSGSTPASWPQVLPDGKTVLFTAGVGADNAIAVMSLDGREKRIVARMSDSRTEGPAVIGTGGGIRQARYVPSGHLVYGQDPGVVRAVPFDLDTLTVTGPPVSMIDGVERASQGGAVYFAVSDTGSLVYASRGDRHQLVWVERNGRETAASSDRTAFRHPRLSPDGKRIAVAVYDETRRPFIWIYDVERGGKKKLDAQGLEPVWSQDGTHLSLASGDGSILELPVDGPGASKTILSPDPPKSPSSWSPDSRHLLFHESGAAGYELRLLDRGPPSTTHALSTRPSTFHGQFSPDGRWIAYVSTESGRAEVYVGRSPDLANTVPVSAEGGARPRWSHNGRELFFRQGEAMMVTSVDPSHGFSLGQTQRLFAGPYAGVGRDNAFDVSADGQRFLMIKADPASTLQSLTLVQNWQEELKRLSPAK
jgi:serine/threonine-protein kinase